MDKREFWATKNPGAVWRCITFAHPSFDATIRLAANVFQPVTLNGNVYTPAPMEINPPQQKGDAQARLRLSFPRQVVGRQFKQQLALIIASGSQAPITVTYELWLAETTAPKVTWVMYAADAGGVVFGTDTVQVNATLDNPQRRDVSLRYLPETFTGLALM